MIDRRANAVLLAVAVAAVGFAAGLRIWIATGPLGVLNADEVVSALMARDVLDGHVTTFFWNQSYGGTLQVFPLAASIALLGDRIGLIVLPLIEWAGICVLTFALARRRLDVPIALAVVALGAVAPATAIWMSTRPMLFYNATLLLGLGAILLADGASGDTDAPDAEHRPRLAAIGLLLGLGWWTSTQILYFAVPALYVLLRHRRVRTWPGAGMLAGGAAVGAAPWLVHNARTSLSSLRSGPPRDGGVGDHLAAQVERGWPMAAGLRRPFDEAWLLPGPGWAYVAVLAAALGLVAWVFLRRPELRTPLAGVLPSFFVLHLLAPTGSFVGTGRYYAFVVPSLAYVVVAALSRVRRGAVLVAALVVVAALGSTLTLHSMRHFQFGPDDPGELLAALDDRGIRHVYANYWVAYPLAWADADLVVSPHVSERRPDWSAAVRAADEVAFVFWLPQGDDAARAAEVVPLLDDVGIAERFEVGRFLVVVPERNVAPEDLTAPG